MARNNVFRDGKVHVMRAMCKTCIFRPGNKMKLDEGRAEQMERDAVRSESTIVCHSTLSTDENAVCRGFYNRNQTMPLRTAQIMGCIKFQTSPNPKGY